MSRLAPMTVESIDTFFDALAARRHIPGRWHRADAFGRGLAGKP